MRCPRIAATVVLVVAIVGLADTAKAFYHPSVGRWVQRDPIGYQDGMSLCEYEGSEPCYHLDPDGLAEVTITVLPGWYREPGLTVPGQTRYGCRVTGKCVCVDDPPPKKWKMVDSKADCQIAITMNPDRFRGAKDRDENPVTPEGVFGHEQKHAQRTQSEMQRLSPQITTTLQEAERIDFQTEELCVHWLNNLRRSVQSVLGNAAERAGKHASDDPNDNREENDGWPVDKKQYPPDPGTYSPTESGVHVPWQGDRTVSGNSVYNRR